MIAKIKVELVKRVIDVFGHKMTRLSNITAKLSFLAASRKICRLTGPSPISEPVT